jgi:toxin-antitoxin system, antitoxin component, xre family
MSKVGTKLAKKNVKMRPKTRKRYKLLIVFFVFFMDNQRKNIKFAQYANIMAMKEDINRLKVVLAEQKRTNKWLAEQLGKDPATVSKWCTNTAQPGLETLLDIARCLNVDVKDLLWSSQG